MGAYVRYSVVFMSAGFISGKLQTTLNVIEINTRAVSIYIGNQTATAMPADARHQSEYQLRRMQQSLFS